MEQALFNEIDHYIETLGSSRLLNKLKQTLDSKQYYEAHQIFKTMFFRLATTEEKLTALEPLLFEGSLLLLRLNEHQSGQDVANLYIEACAKKLSLGRIQPNDQTKDIHISKNVITIAKELPTNSELGLQRFISDLFKTLTPQHINNDILHQYLAIFFWKDKRDYVNSRYHFMHSADIKEKNKAPICTNMLIEYHLSLGYSSESDLFIAQFILQLLCLRQPTNAKKANHSMTSIPGTNTDFKNYAERIFYTYTRDHPNIRRTESRFSQPLLNFLSFLLSILDTKDAHTFKALRDIYVVSLNRDPNYFDYLTRIGTLYFDIADRAQQRQGGLFGNLLQSLLDDNDDESVESDNPDLQSDSRSRGSTCLQSQDDELD